MKPNWIKPPLKQTSLGFLQKVEALKIKLKRDAQNLQLFTLADFLWQLQFVDEWEEKQWLADNAKLLRDGKKKGFIDSYGSPTHKGLRWAAIHNERGYVESDSSYRLRVYYVAFDLFNAAFEEVAASRPPKNRPACDPDDLYGALVEHLEKPYPTLAPEWNLDVRYHLKARPDWMKQFKANVLSAAERLAQEYFAGFERDREDE